MMYKTWHTYNRIISKKKDGLQQYQFYILLGKILFMTHIHQTIQNTMYYLNN